MTPNTKALLPWTRYGDTPLSPSRSNALPLNDDGSVNLEWVDCCDGRVIDIGGPGGLEFVDIDEFIRSIEAHTIERCAKELDVFAVGSTGTTQVAAGHLAKAIRSLKTGGE